MAVTLVKAAAAAVLATVVAMSFLPAGIEPTLPQNLGHVLGYALLTVVACLSISFERRSLGMVFLVVVAASVLGMTIELLQPLVERTSSAKDVLSNQVGIAIGAIAALTATVAQRVARGREDRRAAGAQGLS